MQYVRSYIGQKQSQFAEIDFFRQLEQNESSETALSFIRKLTFFVMAFQDILRLNEARVTDPAMRRIARHHRAEDKGHDLWFLHDLMAVDGSIPDVRELFSTCASTRDTAYELLSEVFRTDDDCTRVALLFVLESTGHVFFRRVVENAERVGVPQQLLYFARKHLDIEVGHELFEEEMNATVDAVELTAAQRRTIIETVDRSFKAMTTMISALQEGFVEERISMPPPSSMPPASRVISRQPRQKHAIYKRASNEEP